MLASKYMSNALLTEVEIKPYIQKLSQQLYFYPFHSSEVQAVIENAFYLHLTFTVKPICWRSHFSFIQQKLSKESQQSFHQFLAS